MAENNIGNESVGLSKLCANINKIFPQCMPMYRNYCFKLGVLSTAVASYKRSNIPMLNKVRGKIDYKRFQTSLDHTITLEKESQPLLNKKTSNNLHT